MFLLKCKRLFLFLFFVCLFLVACFLLFVFVFDVYVVIQDYVISSAKLNILSNFFALLRVVVF